MMNKKIKPPIKFSLLFLTLFSLQSALTAQSIHFSISFPNADLHNIQVELNTSGWNGNTLSLTMPNWTPGYYQLMDYAKDVTDLYYFDDAGKKIIVPFIDQKWIFPNKKNKNNRLLFNIRTSKQFVANSYVDSNHAYIIPGSVLPYINDKIKNKVFISIKAPREWKAVATGLSNRMGNDFELVAENFDNLYDSPILIGALDSLKPFQVSGIEHRFVGYRLGNFDRDAFMNKLQKMVVTASNIIGDIPYHHYSFIGIGPGRGGIEHLNSTTVSFDGNELNKPGGINRMMSFLAHEYFHHYNVKRIRPFELGPFDYTKENRTNLLWVSEGLSVYYEYLIVKRAGIIDETTLFKNFEHNINAVENNPGRKFQSLSQASYDTWSDGPFGKQGAEADKSISYYDKGPVVGLLFDFAIRHATGNRKSLDDVMRYLYYHYYKTLQRGFTDAEFQQACESVAERSLSNLFEYVYTTKELEYETYFGYAGLKLEKNPDPISGKIICSIQRINNPTKEQLDLFNSWLGN